MNRVRIETENPDATELLGASALGPGALIVVEASPTGGGAGFAEIGTVALVAGIDAYTFYDPAGAPGTFYRTTYDNAARTATPDYSAEFQVATAETVVAVGTVRALVPAGRLDDSDLADIIAREETLLAAEVGALVGSRTETFVLTDRTVAGPVRLARPTSAVTVTEDNVATTDVRLAGGRTVQRLLATGWGSDVWRGVVEVTYTPGDQSRITTWVIELVRARLAETGFDSETAADYSYDRGQRSHEATMAAAVADILGLVDRTSVTPSRRLRSVRMSTDATPRPWAGTGRP